MPRAELVSLKGREEVGGSGINGAAEGVSMRSLGGGQPGNEDASLLVDGWRKNLKQMRQSLVV